jgi:hypothetical protein
MNSPETIVQVSETQNQRLTISLVELLQLGVKALFLTFASGPLVDRHPTLRIGMLNMREHGERLFYPHLKLVGVNGGGRMST